MPNQLQNGAAVSDAVRRLLAAGLAGYEVADAMTSLIAVTSLLSLNNLDNWERKIRAELWAMEQRLSPTRWNASKTPARFASWLDLCSGDGFKRERILRTLSEGAPNGFFCSLALRRLNDWVPQVRAAAREHLPHIVERSNPERVVDALWSALAHCASWGRMQDADRQILADLISIKQVALALKSRIMKATAGPVTQILSQAGRAPALDGWLGEFASAAIQPSVRAKAYRCLLEGRMVWVVGRKWKWTDLAWCKGRFEPVLGERALSSQSGHFVANLRMASVDRSPLVRRVAAELLIKHLSSIGADAPRFAEQLASDPSAYVAERGRFALARLGGHAT